MMSPAEPAAHPTSAMPRTEGRSDGCSRSARPAHALLQRGESVEHQRETGERGARRRDAPARQQLDQRPDEDQRQRIGRERHAHADQRDQPAGAGRADIGAEDEAEPLREGEQARADQPNGGHRHRARRLHEQGYDRAPEGARERRRRRLAERGAQGGSGERLQPVGHHRHAEQEQPDAAEDRDGRAERTGHRQDLPIAISPPPVRRGPPRAPSSARPIWWDIRGRASPPPRRWPPQPRCG